MLKLAGWIGVVAVAAWAGASTNHGCRDMISSHTHLNYYPVRDMRRSVAIMPQKVSVRAPDSLSVPITGKEWAPDPNDLMANRDKIAARWTDTIVANDDSSVARGERVFHTFCVPCHGMSMKGDGPVAAKFMPPPDLMGATTRGRSDGYIYSYVRYGGAVMPRYGQAVTPHMAWDVIHFLRQQQKANPR